MNLGRYRLVGQLGTGADGLAFRALEDETGAAREVRDLAGARTDPARWRQLVRQLRLAALLQNPAQRRLLDMNLDHDPPFIVLEVTDAPPLAEVRQEDLPWAPAQVHKLALEIGGALEEAHRLGLVHGALGPSKIHWQSGEPAKVDFTGADCYLQAPCPVADACHAPNSQPKKPSLDPADDMYALGVILSWLLRGRPAPPGWSMRADYPERADQTPLLALIESLLRPDANDRPNAQAVLEALAFGAAATFQPGGDGEHSGNRVTDFESTRVACAPLPRAVSDTGTTLMVVGRFHLLQLLGEGGLGKVYRAEDVTDGSMVAIKILHPHLASRPAILQRFVKEARLLREVHSPFIANILEINEDLGTHYLALEFIDGPSLNELLRDRAVSPRGRLDEAVALALIIDVARGLADAHRRGIIHRDIKPQNIMVVRGSGLFRMLAKDGTAAHSHAGSEPGTKLCDFGLARHVLETDSLHLTQEGTPLGTPLYMSPEQAAGRDQLGPTTDVYALGVTLYQLLAGRPPFVADSALALSLLHINEPPPPLTQFEPTLSDGICRIVYRCLAKKADERYPDADALLGDLERLLRGEPASMALHPRLPTGTNVLQYDWSWELASSPALLWPFVSNTERLNRAAGVPAVQYRTEVQTTSVGDDPKPPVRRIGAFRKAGVDNIWREHPFEWVEGRRMGVLREYEKGVFKWLTSTTELVPRPDGGSTLTMQIRVEPRNFLGRLVAGLEVGFKGRKRLEAVYRRIDAYLTGQLAGPAGLDPFEEPVRLSRDQTRRLEQHLRDLLDKNVPADVVGQLVAFLENAPDQEVARIRPLALARRLGVSGDAMVAACLQGARAGLLVLLWDILCPLCRIPAGIVDTLKALKEHAHCEACQADFALDFTKSVEMVFRVHPEVRTCETRTYCIGGPAHSPHVVAQVRVAPGERFDLDLALPEGAYRVRGPQLPRAFDFDVAAGAFLTRWLLQVPGDLTRSGSGATLAEGTLLRAGQQRLVFQNDHAEELILRVERTAQREDALTAARAASSALFRELFPGEILDSGKLVSVAAVTLLVIDLSQATNLDNPDNLYQALGEARTFALLHDYFQIVEEGVHREGGALIKTLGETVLAAFEDKAAAVRAGLLLAQSLAKDLGRRWPTLARPLQIRAGIHHGPAMSATVNGTLDYFGTTVDQALRLPSLVEGNHLVLSRALAADRRVVELLRAFKLKPEVLAASLPGQPVGVLLSTSLTTNADQSQPLQ